MSKTPISSKSLGLAVLALALLLLSWAYALTAAPPDAQQGMVYKIIFVHVPSAACALGLSGIGMFVASLLSLIKPSEKALLANRAWVEVGLAFTCLTLITGSLWGRPTWGTYWTWDARLTTTLLLALLQIAFLMFYRSLPQGQQRIRIMGILGLIIVIDIPIIYKSVEWWRTLHQPASLIAERGRTMDSDMLSILLMSLAACMLVNFAFWFLRFENLKLQSELDDITYSAMRS